MSGGRGAQPNKPTDLVGFLENDRFYRPEEFLERKCGYRWVPTHVS
jgi:hypothetical protein